MNKVAATLVGLIVIFGVGTLIFVFGGHLYMGADIEPGSLEASLAMKVVDSWIDQVKPEGKNPVPATPENLSKGVKLYMKDCAGCHGSKKHPKSGFGLAMYPPAPQFMDDTPDMEDDENFVVIKHGIRWTGMPGWNKMLSKQEIWTLSTFLSHMTKLPPDAEAEWSK